MGKKHEVDLHTTTCKPFESTFEVLNAITSFIIFISLSLDIIATKALLQPIRPFIFAILLQQ